MKKITFQIILVAFICVPANLFSQKKNYTTEIQLQTKSRIVGCAG